METITLCGFRCDLCKAYAPNINANDRRAAFSVVWEKYHGWGFTPEDIHCKGCPCNEDALSNDQKNCPVRICVMEKGIDHCGDCDAYPCDAFLQRKGRSFMEAREQLGGDFNEDEYFDFFFAYDNKTRLDRYKKMKCSK